MTDLEIVIWYKRNATIDYSYLTEIPNASATFIKVKKGLETLERESNEMFTKINSRKELSLIDIRNSFPIKSEKNKDKHNRTFFFQEEGWSIKKQLNTENVNPLTPLLIYSEIFIPKNNTIKNSLSSLSLSSSSSSPSPPPPSPSPPLLSQKDDNKKSFLNVNNIYNNNNNNNDNNININNNNNNNNGDNNNVNSNNPRLKSFYSYDRSDLSINNKQNFQNDEIITELTKNGEALREKASTNFDEQKTKVVITKSTIKTLLDQYGGTIPAYFPNLIQIESGPSLLFIMDNNYYNRERIDMNYINKELLSPGGPIIPPLSTLSKINNSNNTQPIRSTTQNFVSIDIPHTPNLTSNSIKNVNTFQNLKQNLVPTSISATTSSWLYQRPIAEAGSIPIPNFISTSIPIITQKSAPVREAVQPLSWTVSTSIPSLTSTSTPFLTSTPNLTPKNLVPSVNPSLNPILTSNQNPFLNKDLVLDEESRWQSRQLIAAEGDSTLNQISNLTSTLNLNLNQTKIEGEARVSAETRASPSISNPTLGSTLNLNPTSNQNLTSNATLDPTLIPNLTPNQASISNSTLDPTLISNLTTNQASISNSKNILTSILNLTSNQTKTSDIIFGPALVYNPITNLLKTSLDHGETMTSELRSDTTLGPTSILDSTLNQASISNTTTFGLTSILNPAPNPTSILNMTSELASPATHLQKQFDLTPIPNLTPTQNLTPALSSSWQSQRLTAKGGSTRNENPLKPINEKKIGHSRNDNDNIPTISVNIRNQSQSQDNTIIAKQQKIIHGFRGFTLSALKSIFQKIIRYSPNIIEIEDEKYDAELVLTVCIYKMLLSPSSFNPDVSTSERGLHVFIKRLMIILVEDACLEDNYEDLPSILLELAAGSLLSTSNDWWPSKVTFNRWLEYAKSALKSNIAIINNNNNNNRETKYKSYDISVLNELPIHDDNNNLIYRRMSLSPSAIARTAESGSTLSNKDNEEISDFKKMKIVSFLLDNYIHSLKSDCIMMHNISKIYLEKKEEVEKEEVEKEKEGEEEEKEAQSAENKGEEAQSTTLEAEFEETQSAKKLKVIDKVCCYPYN
jgi:hypothetical protein